MHGIPKEPVYHYGFSAMWSSIEYVYLNLYNDHQDYANWMQFDYSWVASLIMISYAYNIIGMYIWVVMHEKSKSLDINILFVAYGMYLWSSYSFRANNWYHRKLYGCLDHKCYENNYVYNQVMSMWVRLHTRTRTTSAEVRNTIYSASGASWS